MDGTWHILSHNLILLFYSYMYDKDLCGHIYFFCLLYHVFTLLQHFIFKAQITYM